MLKKNKEASNPTRTSGGDNRGRPSSGVAAVQVAQQRSGGPGGETAAQPSAQQLAAGRPTAHARRDEQASPPSQGQTTAAAFLQNDPYASTKSRCNTINTIPMAHVFIVKTSYKLLSWTFTQLTFNSSSTSRGTEEASRRQGDSERDPAGAAVERPY